MFKIPSLRNLAYTYPYMHDGRFGTLHEVLEHYEKGIVQTPGLAKELQQPIVFNAEEKEALLAFLATLNDSTLVSDSSFRKPE